MFIGINIYSNRKSTPNSKQALGNVISPRPPFSLPSIPALLLFASGHKRELTILFEKIGNPADEMCIILCSTDHR